MPYRTKLDIGAIQRDVQHHLQELRERGLHVPSNEKPSRNTGLPQPDFEVPGFAESPTYSKKISGIE